MPEYINPPGPSTDPVDISDGVVEYIQTFFPNYEPSEGQLAWIIVLALALRVAELDDLCRMIPKSIFRSYGLNVLNFPPVDATPAFGLINVTVRDTVGYTLAADDVRVNIEDPDGELHEFVANSDVSIPGGQSVALNVPVTASVEGTDANAITNGPASLAESLDAVIGVAHVGTTSGGTDAEEDEEYLDRLTRRLGLIVRPVTAEDFSRLVLVQYPEVYRSFAVDNYVPGVNEVQQIVHTATAGTFTVVIEAGTSAAVNWNESNATLIGKLEAVGAVGVGNVAIKTGGPLPAAVQIEFKGTLKESNRTQMSAGTNSLTGGGGSGSLVFSTITQGAVASAVSEKNITIANIDAAGAAISSILKTEISAYLQTQRLWGFTVNLIDPTITLVDVTSTFTVMPGYTPSEVETAVDQALEDYLNAATWAALPGDARSSRIQNTIYLWEIVAVINNVQGVDRLVTLLTGLASGAQSTTDKVLTGTVPLPNPGNLVNTAI